MSIDFFQTVMGRQFYDGTLPRIAKALERIANALEAAKAPPPAPDTVVLDRELFDMAHAAVAFAVGASGASGGNGWVDTYRRMHEADKKEKP